MITKRTAGIALALIGLTIAGGAAATDWLGAGNSAGLGPAQQLTVIVGLATFAVGLSLIPLGNRPA